MKIAFWPRTRLGHAVRHGRLRTIGLSSFAAATVTLAGPSLAVALPAGMH